jgi:hypothetical protein
MEIGTTTAAGANARTSAVATVAYRRRVHP